MDIKDLICRGNAVFQGLVNGRDIATDGAKLDSIDETIIGTFDMATTGSITINSASSGLVLIKGFRAIVTAADNVSTPGSFSLKFYNVWGSQITYSMAVNTFVGFGSNCSAVLATTSDFVADLSQGDITIEWTASTATSHIWKYYLDVQLVNISQAQWNEMRKNAFLYKFLKSFQNDLILVGANSLLTFQQNLYSLINKNIDYYPPSAAAYDLFENKYVTDSRAFVTFSQDDVGDDFIVSFDEDYHVEPFLADVHFCFYKNIESDNLIYYHFKNVFIPDGVVVSGYDTDFFNGDWIYGMAVVKIGDKVTNLLFKKSNSSHGDYGYDFYFKFYP